MSRNLTAFLLLVCFARHYGWALVDPAVAGVVSKTLGAAAAISLLGVIAYFTRPTKVLMLVIVWYCLEELQTVTCGTMYLIEPWVIEPGQAMCSSKLGFDLGTIGIFLAAVAAYYLTNDNGK